MSKKQRNIKYIKRQTQPKKLNEIRTNYSFKGKGHPSYIYKKVGNKYHFIGLTHAPVTRGIKNISLYKNPDPESSHKTYARPFSEKDKIRNFGHKHKGWKISRKDRKRLTKIKK